eukprot:scaffold4081_cov145-Skeletonema_menzelii.AAC.7
MHVTALLQHCYSTVAALLQECNNSEGTATAAVKSKLVQPQTVGTPDSAFTRTITTYTTVGPRGPKYKGYHPHRSLRPPTVCGWTSKSSNEKSSTLAQQVCTPKISPDNKVGDKSSPQLQRNIVKKRRIEECTSKEDHQLRKKVAENKKHYRYSDSECLTDGCTKKVQQGGVCRIRHGAKKDRYKYKCSADGCTNGVVNGGVCMRHGAKVRRCSNKGGCTNYAVKGGVCMRHGAKVKRCSIEGCTSYAKQGGVCIRHGAKVKRCSSEGCMKNAVKGGVCVRHGAKVKRCSSEGCTKNSVKGGVCIRHGAKVKYSSEV